MDAITVLTTTNINNVPSRGAQLYLVLNTDFHDDGDGYTAVITGVISDRQTAGSQPVAYYDGSSWKYDDIISAFPADDIANLP